MITLSQPKYQTMKKLFVFLLAFLQFTLCSSQINPGLGIYDLDSCDFESDCSMVRFDTLNQGIWQVGTPFKSNFTAAYSPVHAILTDSLNPYPGSNHSWFELAIPNTSWFNILIEFKHKFDTDTLLDGGYIEPSYDDEGIWTNVLYDGMVHGGMVNFENLYSPADSLANGEPGFSGYSTDWVTTRMQWIWVFPVKSFPPDTLRLRFYFVSDSVQTNKDGWMIDDLLISYVDLGGSIDEISISNKINLYPNPGHDFIWIESMGFSGDYLTLDIFNLQGPKVNQLKTVTSDKIKVDITNLEKGIYFVQIRNSQKVFGTGKFLKE